MIADNTDGCWQSRSRERRLFRISRDGGNEKRFATAWIQDDTQEFRMEGTLLC